MSLKMLEIDTSVVACAEGQCNLNGFYNSVHAAGMSMWGDRLEWLEWGWNVEGRQHQQIRFLCFAAD